MLSGRQIAHMIYSHFRLTEVDGAVLEFTDLLKVELKKDNVRAFDTAWDETLLGMASLPEEHDLESLYLRQLEKSEQLQNPLALYVQDHVQRGEPKSYAKLRNMVRNHLDHQTRERHIAQREKRSERGLASPANPKAKEHAKATAGDCHQWTRKGQCSRGDNCKLNHEEAKRGSLAKSPRKEKQERGRSQTSKGQSEPGNRQGPRRGRHPSGKMTNLVAINSRKDSVTKEKMCLLAPYGMSSFQKRKMHGRVEMRLRS